MPSREVTECGSCGSGRLENVLWLGATPPACSMLPVGDRREQERYPLELLGCRDCGLVQLSVVVDPEVVFHPTYPYSTGNSAALVEHFAALAAQLDVGPDDLVVDVGANDGTFLANLACRRIAVEPTNQARSIRDGDVDVFQTFFTNELAAALGDVHGPARYVVASNVLAHVADPHDVLEGVRALLADDGTFVTENHDVASVAAGQWDTVYHEHLRYYSPGSLARLLRQHGLYVDRVEKISTHGGSFRAWASTRRARPRRVEAEPDLDWAKLRDAARRTRWYLRADLAALRSGRERVGAIGATARATTILGYCGLDADDLEAVYEVVGSEKIGHYMPGTRIPVVDEEVLGDSHAPGNAVLFAWYLADGLVPKVRRKIGYTGKLIVPLPEVRHLRA